jgi:hypothetical protein
MINPVTDIQQLEQYAQLGRTEFERGLKESGYKINENVYTESRKADPTDPNTTTQRVINWGIYNIRAQSINGPHLGVNVDVRA